HPLGDLTPPVSPTGEAPTGRGAPLVGSVSAHATPNTPGTPGPPRAPEVDAFWAHVDRGSAEGCWPWVASVDAQGYGQFQVYRDGRRFLGRSHRLAWEFTYGEIPAGVRVTRRCGTKLCCRPEHLALTTQRALVRQAVASGRLAPRRKVSDEDAAEIRRRHAAGEPGAEIAAAFGISQSHVSNIAYRRRRR
ncbi:MAG: HNH endonuclease, partial [Dehalococcoidia bacterium]